MNELLILKDFSLILSTPLGMVLIYCFAKLNNKISILEVEIKHLKESINGKIYRQIEK